MSLAELYLGVVGILMFGAFIEHAFLSRLVASWTNWGHTPGWQREIAFWNLGLLVVIAGVLWTENETGARIVTAATIVLTALFGTNHLLAFRSDRRGWTHRWGAIVNYAGVAAGIAVLLLVR